MREFQIGESPTLLLDETSILDIGSCIIEGTDVSPRRAIPDDGDPRIDHSLEGFLFTCGPDHLRHPYPIKGRSDGVKYPLHGSFSGHEAKITLVKQAGDELSVRGEAVVTSVDGTSWILNRQWLLNGVTGEVTLKDKVTNLSSHDAPVFHMYHMNIAGKLLGDETQMVGTMLNDGGEGWRFGDEDGGVFCIPTKDDSDGFASFTLGPIAKLNHKSLNVSFRVDTLPHLQIWRNQTSPANVFGIEPVSHRWIDRDVLEQSGEFVILKPNESKNYMLRFRFR